MRILLTGLLILCVFDLFAQGISKTVSKISLMEKIANKDTVIEKDTSKENQEPRYFYITTGANFFVSAKGGVAERFIPSIEVGKTYGIFDIGVASGQFSTTRTDTTHFFEFRPTINIFSKGRFSEGLCLGVGYVAGAKQALVTEICNSINFNISEKLEVAILQGFYYFDGTNSSRNMQYMGLNLTYNLLKKHSVNLRRKKEAIISDK
ncbi:MAG: hypothetical protein ABI367_01730 [Mucilaginibacter sp.]